MSGLFKQFLAAIAERLPQKVTKLAPVVLAVVGVFLPYWAAFKLWGFFGPLASIALILGAWLFIQVEGERFP